jgi:hypothetical protein
MGPEILNLCWKGVELWDVAAVLVLLDEDLENVRLALVETVR